MPFPVAIYVVVLVAAVVTVAALVAAVVAMPGAAAGFARSAEAAVPELEAAAHCSELEAHHGAPQP